MATVKQRGIPFFAAKDTEETPADLQKPRERLGGLLKFYYREAA
jgi:hypothetical protein